MFLVLKTHGGYDGPKNLVLRKIALIVNIHKKSRRDEITLGEFTAEPLSSRCETPAAGFPGSGDHTQNPIARGGGHYRSHKRTLIAWIAYDGVCQETFHNPCQPLINSSLHEEPRAVGATLPAQHDRGADGLPRGSQQIRILK
jgi:hypothetical protein